MAGMNNMAPHHPWSVEAIKMAKERKRKNIVQIRKVLVEGEHLFCVSVHIVLHSDLRIFAGSHGG